MPSVSYHSRDHFFPYMQNKRLGESMTSDPESVALSPELQAHIILLEYYIKFLNGNNRSHLRL